VKSFGKGWLRTKVNNNPLADRLKNTENEVQSPTPVFSDKLKIEAPHAEQPF
jgi:hypothetical protein